VFNNEIEKVFVYCLGRNRIYELKRVAELLYWWSIKNKLRFELGSTQTEAVRL